MTGPAHWTHQAAFTPEPRHVAQARAFVTGHLAEAYLAHAADAVRLVVSELATNAVIHAATPFTVSLSRNENALRLEVRDHLLGHVDGPTPPSSTSTRGRGLQVVAASSSTWGVRAEGDGKSVWATFDLAGPPV